MYFIISGQCALLREIVDARETDSHVSGRIAELSRPKASGSPCGCHTGTGADTNRSEKRAGPVSARSTEPGAVPPLPQHQPAADLQPLLPVFSGRRWSNFATAPTNAGALLSQMFGSDVLPDVSQFADGTVPFPFFSGAAASALPLAADAKQRTPQPPLPAPAMAAAGAASQASSRRPSAVHALNTSTESDRAGQPFPLSQLTKYRRDSSTESELSSGVRRSSFSLSCRARRIQPHTDGAPLRSLRRRSDTQPRSPICMIRLLAQTQRRQ